MSNNRPAIAMTPISTLAGASQRATLTFLLLLAHGLVVIRVVVRLDEVILLLLALLSLLAASATAVTTTSGVSHFDGGMVNGLESASVRRAVQGWGRQGHAGEDDGCEDGELHGWRK